MSLDAQKVAQLSEIASHERTTRDLTSTPVTASARTDDDVVAVWWCW